MAAISSTSYFSSQPQLSSSRATTNSRNNGRKTRTRRTGSCVMLEGATSVSAAVVGRIRSLMEEDLDELKGFLDFGFGFTYHEISRICGTLPGLELCYSMTRRFLDEQREPLGQLELATTTAAAPIPDWKISGPGMVLGHTTGSED